MLDCRDGSDESNCSEWKCSDQSVVSEACSEECSPFDHVHHGHFLSYSLSFIPQTASHCQSHQFECTSGYCIPMPFVCDHWDDCGDNSDEQNCGGFHSTSWPILPKMHGLQKINFYEVNVGVQNIYQVTDKSTMYFWVPCKYHSA